MAILWGIAILGWIIVLIRPSYGLVWLLAAVMLIASTTLGALPAPELLGRALGSAVVHAGAFAFVAATIVSFRGDKSGARSGKKVDKEMERIRAEIAAREANPPGTN